MGSEPRSQYSIAAHQASEPYSTSMSAARGCWTNLPVGSPHDGPSVTWLATGKWTAVAIPTSVSTHHSLTKGSASNWQQAVHRELHVERVTWIRRGDRAPLAGPSPVLCRPGPDVAHTSVLLKLSRRTRQSPLASRCRGCEQDLPALPNRPPTPEPARWPSPPTLRTARSSPVPHTGRKGGRSG